MKGAIIVNGFYRSGAYSHQVSRLADEFAKRGHTLEIIRNDSAYGLSSFDFDYALFLDKDVNLARFLEQSGIILFNNSFALENCDDKIKTAVSLSRHTDIALPKTLFAPLQYIDGDKDDGYFEAIERRIGYPMVVKSAVSSLGMHVYLAENRAQLADIERSLSFCPHLYQVYVEESRGRSVRAFVIGQKVAASILLSNTTDFRSNAAPSTAEEAELDEGYTAAAEKIASYLELDYCAVDFFVGAPLVIEVNSNAFFEKIEAATKKNIAGIYADYILGFLKEIAP